MNFLINLSHTNKLVLFPIHDHNNNLFNQTKWEDDSIHPNMKRFTSRLVPCAAKSGRDAIDGPGCKENVGELGTAQKNCNFYVMQELDDRHPSIAKRASKSRKRVVTIPASTGRWPGKWTCEYIISLKDLALDDLAEDGPKGGGIEHAGFGLSVEGRVITNIARKCSSCSSPYIRKVDTSVSVWVLPNDSEDSSTIPQIGGDDPSVIYVKPGCEANLDSLIQDTIRLQIAVKETCSESCENSEPKLHYIGDQRTASLEQRWSRLLHLRNASK